MSGSRGGKLIVLGAAAGVCLALLVRKPPAETHAASEPAAPAASVVTIAATAATTSTSASVATAAPSAAPSGSSARAASTQASVPSVPPPPEVADLAELKTAEIRCYQKDADACYRAAAAYASGKLLPADQARAESYRKVELTQLFRQCEKAAVRPCLVLAERYSKGDGLPLDEKKAQKLLKHVGELCQRRPAPECALLESR